MKLDLILEKAKLTPHNLSRDELAFLLSLEHNEEQQRLFDAAYEVKLRFSGKKVSLRGLIEMGNVCVKNCSYCGIRHDNAEVERFELDLDAIERMAEWAWRQKYGSVVLQAGEIESPQRTEKVEKALQRIAACSHGELGVTLSLGEQSEEVYRRWRDAGAHRYLLRIESSSPDFYKSLHPENHSFSRRLGCLEILRKLDYQVGSGIMIGVPGQTLEHLLNDLEFFRKMDLDMIGMGPYLPHHSTPLGKEIELTAAYAQCQLKAGLKMIAVTRLYLHSVNIASTTALQALADNGRELGLLAGANVIMPNITDTTFRKNYQLYENKPCMDENSETSRDNLARRVESIGEEINWGEWGDSKHYSERKNSV